MMIDPVGNVGDDGRGFSLGAGEVADQYRKGIATAIPDGNNLHCYETVINARMCRFNMQ